MEATPIGQQSGADLGAARWRLFAWEDPGAGAQDRQATARHRRVYAVPARESAVARPGHPCRKVARGSLAVGGTCIVDIEICATRIPFGSPSRRKVLIDRDFIWDTHWESEV